MLRLLYELKTTQLDDPTFRRALISICKQLKQAAIKDNKQQIKQYLNKLSDLIAKEFYIKEKVKIYYIKGKTHEFNQYPNAAVIFIPIKNKPIVEVDNDNNIKFNVKIGIIINKKLLELLTPEEIAAVLSHEIGHIYYNKPVRQSTLLRFLTYISTAIGINPLVLLYHFPVTVALLIISFPLLISSSILSRKAEYLADSFATKIGLGKELISALNKIEQYYNQKYKNKPNIIKRLIIKLLSTHPEHNKRICAIYKDILNQYPKEVAKDIERNFNLNSICR